MKNKYFIIITLVSSLLSLGCGGGSDHHPHHSNPPTPPVVYDSGYYDSSCNNVRFLAETGKKFQTFNQTTTQEIKGIPVTANESIYAYLITNPSTTDSGNITISGPMAKKSDRAATFNKSPFYGSVEGILAKDSIARKTHSKALANRSVRKSTVSNALTSHKEEKVGDIVEIDIKLFNALRKNCQIVAETPHCKMILDKDEYKGKKAALLDNSVIDNFAKEFEDYVYPILRDIYGEGGEIFWNDVDQDNRVSIVFTPVLNSEENLIGFFDIDALYQGDKSRDIIYLSVPINENDNKWVTDARETIIHEATHLIRYSSPYVDDLWIEEGFATFSEAYYRKKRGENGLESYDFNDNKVIVDNIGNDMRFQIFASFYSYFAYDDFGTEEDTLTLLAKYGQKGMFFYFLFDRFGQEQFKKFIQRPSSQNRFANPDNASIQQLFMDFNIAVMLERLRNIDLGFAKNPYYAVTNSKQKFKTNMEIYYSYESGQRKLVTAADMLAYFDRFSIANGNLSIEGGLASYGATGIGFIKQPKDFSNLIHTNNYTLRFTSNTPLIITLMKIN